MAVTLVLAALSHQVNSLTALRPPCCEAQTSFVKNLVVVLQSIVLQDLGELWCLLP